MKKIVPALLISLVIAACGGKNIPDVSDVKVDLEVQRFEQDLFAIDTNHIYTEYVALQKKYPTFLHEFTLNILGLPPLSDTAETEIDALKRFLRDYRPVKDSADKVFRNFDKIAADVKQGLQFVGHYFPGYPSPKKLITFIGPMDAYFEGSTSGYGDVITSEALATGLQLHMGADFSMYKSQMGLSLYPSYISRRFTPECIPVNCIKNIVDDMFPDNSGSKSLVEQMVEKGKRIYLLDKLLPYTPDTLKIGYTKNQLEGCYKNEGLIWNYFLTQGLLYNSDPGMIKNYVSDAPNTPEFGEGSPGYLGLFTGWQIVKKYMDKNADITLQTLMKTDARKLFEESKYKPK